jgi:hypothetical protein
MMEAATPVLGFIMMVLTALAPLAEFTVIGNVSAAEYTASRSK